MRIVRFKTGGDNLAIWILSQRMLPPIAVVFPIFLAYADIRPGRQLSRA